MDGRRTWQTPRPAVRGRADHTGIVGCGLFDGGTAVRNPGSAADLAELYEQARARDGAFVWLGLHEPSEAALNRVAEVFGLHPLAVEDILHREQRVKVERYGDVVFLVVRAARYLEHEQVTGMVRLFAGPHFVITVRQGTVMELSSLRDDLSADAKLLTGGPWSVVHAILDRLVDGYTDIVTEMQTDLDLIEASVFAAREPVTVEQIYRFKREQMRFKAAVLPLERVLSALTGFTDLVPEIRHYFADVADHHHAVVEQVVAFDEVVTALLQARLTQLTMDQNNDLRTIASWAAIGTVPTVIAGVYGTNFTWIPGLSWHYGYPSVMLLILVSVGVLYLLLRRAGWL